MNWWQILLIVVGVLLGIIFIILPSIILPYAGKETVKMLHRCDNGMKGVKNMDVSFYDRGPTKKAASEGLVFMDEVGCSEVYITSYDGLRLQAYYFKNPKQIGNRVLLGMHGFRSGPRHEFAPYIENYFKLGYSLLLPCERAHYKSEGEYITMGSKERYDVVSWCNYITSSLSSDCKILIHGISMGAATVCLSSSLDLPKNVIGIISDCGYSSFYDQLTYTMKQFKAPAGIFLRAIGYYTKKIGLDLRGEGPIDAVKNSKVPILFMHGEIDEIVPVELSKRLYKACGNKKRLYIAPGANHAESEASNKEAYFDVIKDFFKDSL